MFYHILSSFGCAFPPVHPWGFHPFYLFLGCCLLSFVLPWVIPALHSALRLFHLSKPSSDSFFFFPLILRLFLHFCSWLFLSSFCSLILPVYSLFFLPSCQALLTWSSFLSFTPFFLKYLSLLLMITVENNFCIYIKMGQYNRVLEIMSLDTSGTLTWKCSGSPWLCSALLPFGKLS